MVFSRFACKLLSVAGASVPLPDFLTTDADNEIRLTGHRIRLIDIAACFFVRNRRPNSLVAAGTVG